MTAPINSYATLAPISLEGLNSVAALQTRVDRKYIVSPETVAAMVLDLPDTTRVLNIDERSAFDYHSVYFDTPQLDSYRSAAQRRRRRWKVRTRLYVDSGECALEVKTKSGRGDTVKTRLPYSAQSVWSLTATAHSFIAGTTYQLCPSSELIPTLSTSYRRTTLADIEAGSRLTVDHDLACTDWNGARTTLGELLIVETKSARSPSPADRWLWANAIRPSKVSKYGTGLAALHPELPSNKWHRTLPYWKLAS